MCNTSRGINHVGLPVVGVLDEVSFESGRLGCGVGLVVAVVIVVVGIVVVVPGALAIGSVGGCYDCRCTHR
jgi:hypothetical protein